MIKLQVSPLHHKNLIFNPIKIGNIILFFEPMEQKDAGVNLIEIENGTPNDFNYYNIEINFSDAIENGVNT